MKQISSVQNSLIKQIIKLQEKSSERKKQKKFVIEGTRELLLAIKGNYVIETLLICTDISKERPKELISETTGCIEISKEVYEKIAYRKSTEGLIGIAKFKAVSLDSIRLNSKNPLILVAEGIEKPGNLGAILRTADAANIDAVFLADAKCDVYNPNVIRSSIGCVFTNLVITGTSEELISYLKSNSIDIFAATLQNSNNYILEDYTKPSAIVVGSEANGLTELWRTASKKNINIPMQGVIDSMNVSVSAAILIFEAQRQRNFKL